MNGSVGYSGSEEPIGPEATAAPSSGQDRHVPGAERPSLVHRLRCQQEADPLLGGLFTALHQCADRIAAHFYRDYDLPYPVISMDRDRRTRMGHYQQRDGLTLVHRINLNPFALNNGVEAAETLAHEMVHLWQAHVGRPCERNYHSQEFHERMLCYGIKTAGKKGNHVGYEGSTWSDWIAEQGDLNLERYLLPGMDQPPPRQMLKWQCSACGFSFRSRRHDVNIVCFNEDCNVPMEPVAGMAASPD